MDELIDRRRLPFALAGFAIFLIAVLVARLPEAFVEGIENNRLLSDAQAGWAYRLLAVIAIGQAAYGAFVVVRAERARAALAEDARTRALPRPRLVRIVARTGATMVVLTLVYGLAAFAMTGQRAGFWLFILVALAQALWYYREAGRLARALAAEPVEEPVARPWRRGDEDFCPALARGLSEPPLPAS